jgi:hypothetical protein
MKAVVRVFVICLVTTGLAACSTSSSTTLTTTDTHDSNNTQGIRTVSARIIGDGSTFSLQEAVVESPVAFWFWAPG